MGGRGISLKRGPKMGPNGSICLELQYHANCFYIPDDICILCQIGDS